MAQQIVRMVRKRGGRFLCEASDGLYYDVGDQIAQQKTSQALRHRTFEMRKAKEKGREEDANGEKSGSNDDLVCSSNGRPASACSDAKKTIQVNDFRLQSASIPPQSWGTSSPEALTDSKDSPIFPRHYLQLPVPAGPSNLLERMPASASAAVLLPIRRTDPGRGTIMCQNEPPFFSGVTITPSLSGMRNATSMHSCEMRGSSYDFPLMALHEGVHSMSPFPDGRGSLTSFAPVLASSPYFYHHLFDHDRVSRVHPALSGSFMLR